MSSDEDEELAQMRAQRQARTGVPSLTALRQRLAPQEQANGEEDPADDVGPSTTEAAVATEVTRRFDATVPVEEADTEDMVGPAVPPADSDAEDGDAWDGRGTGEPDEEQDPYRLPVTSEVALEGQGKVVASLDVDHSGSRVVAGSRDYSVKLFDFNGMKSDLRSFRSVEPFEGHPVHAVSWSPTGDAFLAVTGSAKIKVYDRDCILRGETLQGDMYIRDQKNTKGHVSPCTYGQWHPTDRYTAMTSSEDGTVRVWDAWNVVQKTVIKPTLKKPGRVKVTTARYNSDGHIIAAGLENGTIQLWDVKGKFGTSAAVGQVLPPKPQMVAKQDWSYVSGGGRSVYGAHADQSEITSLAFTRDSTTMLSRGADATLKEWDVRKFKTPVHVWEGLLADNATTQVALSPDERLILTGISAGRDGSGGALVFLDRQTRQLVRRIAMPASVVAVQWHPKLNQIMLGVGDKKAGSVRILYDTTWSTRGVLQCTSRKPRPKDAFDFQAPLVIHTPHALPLFREDKPGGKRKREKDRMDPIKSRAPERGSAADLGVGTGGKIGVTGGTLLTQYILKNQGMLRNPADEDIRASILRHAGKEDQFNQFTKAYEKTQPERIFAKEEEEEGSDKDE
ncbi:g9648 [Coccomyxa elongata]